MSKKYVVSHLTLLQYMAQGGRKYRCRNCHEVVWTPIDARLHLQTDTLNCPRVFSDKWVIRKDLVVNVDHHRSTRPIIGWEVKDSSLVGPFNITGSSGRQTVIECLKQVVRKRFRTDTQDPPPPAKVVNESPDVILTVDFFNWLAEELYKTRNLVAALRGDDTSPTLQDFFREYQEGGSQIY